MKSTTLNDTPDLPSDAALARMPDVVRDLCTVLQDNDLLELEVHYGRFRLRLKRGEEVAIAMPAAESLPVPRPAPPAQARPAADAVAGASRTTTIKTPLAGIFYRAPSPGAPPFVKEGDTVQVGQTVCIIEAMKLMNEIGAEAPGRVRKILVQNAAVVEAGQDLMIVEDI